MTRTVVALSAVALMTALQGTADAQPTPAPGAATVRAAATPANPVVTDPDRLAAWAAATWLTEAPRPGHGAVVNQPVLTNPDSPWVLVTERIALDPRDHEPNDLVPLPGSGVQVQRALVEPVEALIAAAAADDITVRPVSGYRSYSHQKALRSGYEARHGEAGAQRFSAEAGHSEHQTGWSLDVDDASGHCSVTACFNDTDTARWLAEHAHEFGFIVRYPEAAESVTGYRHEGWHLRWVGTPAATEMHERGVPTWEDYVTQPLPGITSEGFIAVIDPATDAPWSLAG